LDEDDIRLLEALSDNPATTYEILSALLDMPRRTVSRRIDKLRKSGKIEREGAKKNGRWRVVK
jgi:ATP-dependent DNA helicase RecG